MKGKSRAEIDAITTQPKPVGTPENPQATNDGKSHDGMRRSKPLSG
jgi:hypothetical protein